MSLGSVIAPSPVLADDDSVQAETEQLRTAQQELLDESYITRRAALWQLARMGSRAKPVLPYVFEALNDESDSVRSAACRTLYLIAPDHPQVYEALVRALVDRSDQVRAEAACQLGNYGLEAQKAVPKLIDVLVTPGAEGSDKAAEALRRIDPESMLEPVPELLIQLQIGDEWERAAAACALGSIGPQPRTPTIEDVAQYDPTPPFARSTAGVSFYWMGFDHEPQKRPPVSGELDSRLTAVVPALLEAAQSDESQAVRKHAVVALGRFQQYGLAAVPILIECLSDPGEELQQLSAVALYQIAPTNPDTVTEILAQLENCSHAVRLALFDYIIAIGPAASEAIPILQEMLAECPLGDEQYIAQAIGAIGSEADVAVRTLLKLADTGGQREVIASINAIGQIGPSAKKAIPDLIRIAEIGQGEYSLCLKAMVNLDPQSEDVLECLLKHLSGSDEDFRRSAVEALGQLSTESPARTQGLLSALADEEAAVRINAAVTLMHDANVPSSAITPIAAMFSSDWAYEHYTAAIALTSIGASHPAYINEILEAVASSRETAGDYADYVTGRLTSEVEQAVPYLLLGLQSEDENVFHLTLEELGYRGPAASAAVPALRDLLDHEDRWTRQHAARTLCRIAPEAALPVLEDIIQLLNCQNPELQQQAAWMLGQMGAQAEAALPALEVSTYSWNEDLRLTAAWAIAKIKANAT